MAKHNVVVTFHSIVRCGHYVWGKDKSALGGFDTTFEDLERWSVGKPISLTKLVPHLPDSDVLAVYLLGISRSTDSVMIATWNEVPAGEGGIASVADASVVGNEPTVFVNSVTPNSIPGYATFFWIVPSLNVLATLKLEGTLTGLTAMRGYVEMFLEMMSRFAVLGANGEVVGYRDPGKPTSKALALRPRFRTSEFVKKGPIDHIRKNCASIGRVIRTGRLMVNSQMDQAAYQGVLKFLRGASSSRKVTTEKKLKVELEITPSVQELDSMIKEELSVAHVAGWEDLGFVLKGEASKVYWVSKAKARETFEMNLDISAAGVISLSSMQREIDARRHHLLSILS